MFRLNDQREEVAINTVCPIYSFGAGCWFKSETICCSTRKGYKITRAGITVSLVLRRAQKVLQQKAISQLCGVGHILKSGHPSS
jgi:hypothetical protein